MSFRANPLSLSVPEPAFETWLRDSGFLHVIDGPTVGGATSSSSSSSSAAAVTLTNSRIRTSTTTIAGVRHRERSDVKSFFKTVAALATVNPFAKLSAEDLAGPTPPWTAEFVGPVGSYGWPAAPAQARMRVHENVRRFARNYATLAVLVLVSALYRMPMCLVGLLASVGLWELVRFCNEKWELEQQYPYLRQVLIRVGQIATGVLLYMCKLQVAVLCAISVSYLVMLLHASFRKLTPAPQPIRRTGLGFFIRK